MFKYLFVFTILTLFNYTNSFITPTHSLIKKNTFSKTRLSASSIFPEENYNDLIQDVLDNKITQLSIGTTYKDVVSFSDHYYHTKIDPIVIPNLIQKASELKIPIDFYNVDDTSVFAFIGKIFGNLFNFGIYTMLGIFFLSSIQSLYQINNMRKPSSQQNNQNNRNNFFGGFQPFQNNNNNNNKFFKPNVTLESWAGSPEVIEECREVISYIDNKKLFEEIGADMPKGILFEGPPGTGKTLLAKAIATASNSSFISISGSEFVELFVGLGAVKVRDLFNTARQNKPSIIFIDEIDAIGKQRGSNPNIGSDEREQTLNQLLYEMDGFNNNTDVIILGATNRKDILDAALLRPGRFDRIIKIPLPDEESRTQILDYYLRNKYQKNSLNVSSIAEMTEGFSGAQLKNLLNEAAIMSAKNNNTIIKEDYVYEAYEKSIVGLIKKNVFVPEITQKRVAIHEAGHALLSLFYSNYFDFKKATIKPTYNGAGGYTIFSEKKDISSSGLYTKDILKKRLIVTLGGKAAEHLCYGNEFVSLGANEDLKQANRLAQRMIGNFGMGDKLEVFFNDRDETNIFAGDKYSEYTKSIIDKESLKLIKDAYNEAKYLLENNYDLLILLSEKLKEKIIITNDDVVIKEILDRIRIEN
jgi:cell division protease FtsH